MRGLLEIFRVLALSRYHGSNQCTELRTSPLGTSAEDYDFRPSKSVYKAPRPPFRLTRSVRGRRIQILGLVLRNSKNIDILGREP